jgi:predicted transcriptional regulator
MGETVTTTLTLDAELEKRLRTLAEAEASSPASLMERAISEYVGREEERRQLDEDADAASEEFDRTGLHLTNAEVIAWLEKRARGEAAELPECHT